MLSRKGNHNKMKEQNTFENLKNIAQQLSQVETSSEALELSNKAIEISRPTTFTFRGETFEVSRDNEGFIQVSEGGVELDIAGLSDLEFALAENALRRAEGLSTLDALVIANEPEVHIDLDRGEMFFDINAFIDTDEDGEKSDVILGREPNDELGGVIQFIIADDGWARLDDVIEIEGRGVLRENSGSEEAFDELTFILEAVINDALFQEV